MGTIIVLGLVLSLLSGCAASAIARSRGLNERKWFLVGALTSVIGIAVILVIRQRMAEAKKEV
ncbi:MAG: hypothetical protein AAB759_01010 [Patescibacteria group bacterium]